MILLALRNLARSKRHHGPVAAYLALSLVLVLSVQGLLEGSDRNLRAAYPGALTGDLTIVADTQPRWTLFGFGDSLWADSSLPPVLDRFDELRALVARQAGVAATAGVLAGPALAERERTRLPVWVFGIDGDYAKVMSELSAAGSLGEAGAWLSGPLDTELGQPARLRFLYASGQDFQIAEGPVRGTLSYPAPVTAVERLVLLDAPSARHLFGVHAEAPVAVAPREADLFGGTDLFQAQDTAASSGGDPASLVTRPSRASTPEPPGWHFLVLRLQAGADVGAVQAALNRSLDGAGFSLRAVSWRDAAGGSALYVLWLQTLVAFGLALLTLVGAGSLVNAATGIVVERTSEVGTMRALGASRSRVFLLFGAEALLLALLAFGAALVAAAALASSMNAAQWKLSNPVLSLLLGSSGLRIRLNPVTVGFDAAAVVLLALAATALPLAGILRRPVVQSLQDVPE